jgi:16S rRNA (guanine966-N2)-methyltransferase
VTRVIAGVAGGRRLAVPPGIRTRPTSDRAREGLFATLTALRGTLAGAAVLDLYAGSGAVGLEALSRGAARAVFVEADARAARVIRENLRVVGVPGGTVLAGRVERALARGPGAVAAARLAPGARPGAGGGPAAEGGAYDVVFADPPYAAGDREVARMLTLLADKGWLTPGALVAVERATRSGPVPWPPGYIPARSRRYGEATVWYGLAAGAGPAGAS